MAKLENFSRVRRCMARLFSICFCLILTACGRDESWQRAAVQSQDYLRQHLLSQETCQLPHRQWDPRGEEVISFFKGMHAEFADGPSLDPDQLRKVRVLRFVSSEEMARLKGWNDVDLAYVPLGMVRVRTCDKRPFGGQVRWLEMYFLDPELAGHDPDNAAIMRSKENRETVYVHEALHALGFEHFEGDDYSQSLRDGAAGSRFVYTSLVGQVHREVLGTSFKEAYLAQVPRSF